MNPVLYSFRRCPYAMRARLALQVSGCRVELREVVLRDKPDAFLAVSPSATVPCLVDQSTVIDESLDIMRWALQQNDPKGWLDMPEAGENWITRADGPFKHALDRTKYAIRYPDEDAATHRAAASDFLTELDAVLNPWLFEKPSLADFAILPFVRQFAYIDKPWFDEQPWPNVQLWLDTFLESPEFATIMHKYPQWKPHDPSVYFPN
ncbi:glutathione S-transferase [Sulfitobacter sp. F26169L]|uniref:glutathione S-transferase n=1 Tax=Sulfitobacter sp. F26169L TaxID=2996015 RepID=UPI002260D77D|nr:glutathione S-transferase [Sulfitobacter sp. F26169L]MCX7565728.1 glutathione S-transferase [Sulfitobacter sp. F26169L]